MPPVDGLRVAHSKIHGYGLMTTRAFRAGEILMYADGVIYPEDAKFDDTYALVLPAELDVDGNEAPSMYFDLADQSRWINHSCEPNTEVESTWDPKTTTLQAWWVAKRDLVAGEELTYDYAFVGHLAVPCACGMPGCRGLIVDTDPEELAAVPEELRPLLRIAAA